MSDKGEKSDGSKGATKEQSGPDEVEVITKNVEGASLEDKEQTNGSPRNASSGDSIPPQRGLTSQESENDQEAAGGADQQIEPSGDSTAQQGGLPSRESENAQEAAGGAGQQARFFTTTRPTPVGTTCGNLVLPQKAKVSISDERTHTVKAIGQLTCQLIEEDTREQAASPRWFSERKGRLTASNFHKIKNRQTMIHEKFIKSLISPESFTSLATDYGKENEPKAIDMYKKTTGNHVHECGLVVNPKFPFLGATPDGKVCDSGKTGLLEVKCPYSARHVTITEALKIEGFCLQEKDGSISLKENHTYYTQVQGQMMVSGLDFCDFVVFTPKDVFIQRIDFDNDFAQIMLDKLTKFYHDHMPKDLKEKWFQ